MRQKFNRISSLNVALISNAISRYLLMRKIQQGWGNAGQLIVPGRIPGFILFYTLQIVWKNQNRECLEH